MPPFILACLIGLVAGVRAFLAPAAVAWACYFGQFPVADTHFAFMGNIITPVVLTLLAIAEIVYERTPRSAGNKLFLPKLILRMLLGGFSGAVIGSSHQTNALFVCGAFGVAGAIAGTFGSTVLYELLRKILKRDTAAASAEDALAVLACLPVLIHLH